MECKTVFSLNKSLIIFFQIQRFSFLLDVKYSLALKNFTLATLNLYLANCYVIGENHTSGKRWHLSYKLFSCHFQPEGSQSIKKSRGRLISFQWISITNLNVDIEILASLWKQQHQWHWRKDQYSKWEKLHMNSQSTEEAGAVIPYHWTEGHRGGRRKKRWRRRKCSFHRQTFFLITNLLARVYYTFTTWMKKLAERKKMANTHRDTRETRKSNTLRSGR